MQCWCVQNEVLLLVQGMFIHIAATNDKDVSRKVGTESVNFTSPSLPPFHPPACSAQCPPTNLLFMIEELWCAYVSPSRRTFGSRALLPFTLCPGPSGWT